MVTMRVTLFLFRLRGFRRSFQENLLGDCKHNHGDHCHADDERVRIQFYPDKAAQSQKIHKMAVVGTQVLALMSLRR